MLLLASVCGLFQWRQFEPEVILLAVGWYLRFSLSYRDVEELLGISIMFWNRITGQSNVGCAQANIFVHSGLLGATIVGYEAIHMIRYPGLRLDYKVATHPKNIHLIKFAPEPQRDSCRYSSIMQS
jgi:hypothetical protein